MQILKKVSFVLGVLCWVSYIYGRPVYQVQEINTGLEVITLEDHKVPLVTIVLAVKAGAMTETPDIDGLTHLWEHMFFKGNKRIPNQEAFRKRIRELGIVYNGDTSAELVRYYFTLPSSFLNEGLQFMADAISTPRLDNKELEKERHVVLDEYDRNASQPSFALYKLRLHYIYGPLAYKRDALGTRSIIAKATRQQLLRIKDEVFVPSNSALLISGDMDAKKTIKLVSKHFGHWKNPKSWKPLPPTKFPPFPATKEIVDVHPQAKNISITWTFQGPRARLQKKDSYVADVLISLLQLTTGKFYQKFVDSGLALGAGLGYYTQSQAGELNLYGQVTAQNFQAFKKAIYKEIKAWTHENYFTEQELGDVRRRLQIDYKRELNQPSHYIKSLAFWWGVTGLDYYSSYLKNLQQVSRKDIVGFVKKYLIDKPHVITILTGPEEAKIAGLKDNADRLIKELKIDLGS